MTSSGDHPPFDFTRSLLSHAVLPTTASAYRRDFNVFLRYIWFYYRLSLDDLSSSNIDFYFSEFTSYMWRKHQGGRRQCCVNAKQGALLVLGYHLKPCFSQSDRCMVAWKRRQPVNSALPMPQRWLDVMAWLLARKGNGLQAIGLLVAFGSSLRVSELLGLYGLDILIPNDPRQSGTAAGFRLRTTKTGPNKFARINDPLLIPLLRFLKQITPPSHLVFSGDSRASFNRLLLWACRKLKLSFHFTMHSLRHGSAVKRFLDGEAPDLIRLEGRWSSLHSMETYLQTHTSLLLYSVPL